MVFDNPIVRREGFPRFWRRASALQRHAIVTGYLVAASLPTLLVLYYWGPIGSAAGGSLAAALLGPVSYWPTFLAPVLAPALAAGAIAGERERRSWDLLVLTRLTSSEIIWGKLFSRLMPLLWITMAFIPLATALLVRSGGDLSHAFAMRSFGSVSLRTWPFTLAGWVVGLMVAFANGVMALYISFRSSSTRAALLAAYGVAVGAYFVVTMIIGGISAALLFSPMMRGMMSINPGSHTPPTIPSHLMIWAMGLASLPPFLWGVMVPAVLLPILLRRFSRLDARVRGG